jgi:hypothetical protein
VLDLCASGQDGGPDALRAVGVDERPQAEGSRLAARRLQLTIAEGPSAALADALGGEDLDEIGTVGLALRDRLAQLFGPPVASFRGSSDVSSRGPAISPRAMASRSSLSSRDPGLCTVVKPASRVAYALPAAARVP